MTFCINECSINDNNIVYINKDTRRQEIEESIREQNYDQILEYPPAIVDNEQEKDGENISLHVNEKNLSSGKIEEKNWSRDSEKQNTRRCPLMSTDVSPTPNLSSDTIITSGKQKPDDCSDSVSLLIRELNKLANSHRYNGIVENVQAFVNVFNGRTPEYEMRLGPQVVLHYAEKQEAGGWK